ncbi:MAG: hypothetical protein IPH18_07380 [Chitinophagaceae bacterium]|nr:hypothetical protein [Chitinophagaceae bacterium]
MNILANADVISTISGGSITGAAYCCHTGDFGSFYTDLYNKLQKKNVIKNLLLSWLGLRLLLVVLLLLASFWFLFTPYPWLFPIAIAVILFAVLKYQFSILPISKESKASTTVFL